MTWVTVAEAAQHSHRSKTTIYNLIDAGRLQPETIDGVTMINYRQLQTELGKTRRGRPKTTSNPDLRHR